MTHFLFVHPSFGLYPNFITHHLFVSVSGRVTAYQVTGIHWPTQGFHAFEKPTLLLAIPNLSFPPSALYLSSRIAALESSFALVSLAVMPLGSR